MAKLLESKVMHENPHGSKWQDIGTHWIKINTWEFSRGFTKYQEWESSEGYRCSYFYHARLDRWELGNN